MAQNLHISFAFRTSCRALKYCTKRSHTPVFTPPPPSFTLFNNFVTHPGLRPHKGLPVPHTLPCAAGLCMLALSHENRYFLI